jgi:hypothetical protein
MSVTFQQVGTTPTDSNNKLVLCCVQFSTSIVNMEHMNMCEKMEQVFIHIDSNHKNTNQNDLNTDSKKKNSIYDGLMIEDIEYAHEMYWGWEMWESDAKSDVSCDTKSDTKSDDDRDTKSDDESDDESDGYFIRRKSSASINIGDNSNRYISRRSDGYEIYK